MFQLGVCRNRSVFRPVCVLRLRLSQPPELSPFVGLLVWWPALHTSCRVCDRWYLLTACAHPPLSGCVRDNDKDFHAVRGVSLCLEKNKLFCLLGHNGVSTR